MDGHKAAIVRHNSSGGQLMDTPPENRHTRTQFREIKDLPARNPHTGGAHRMLAAGDRCRGGGGKG